jgi:AcrR family transcriptional regulator
VSTETRKYELKARAERQEQTRRRIVEATVELHGEVGPARTTVAEIARRAGVQRLTVYNHFPDEPELFAACSAHWIADHPLPDLEDALAHTDPAQGLRIVLERLYGWYRDTASMVEKVQRDRLLLPALDRQVSKTTDVALAELAGALAGGFKLRAARRDRLRTLIRLGLDFWTWHRLSLEGLDDRAAAELMAAAIAP